MYTLQCKSGLFGEMLSVAQFSVTNLMWGGLGWNLGLGGKESVAQGIVRPTWEKCSDFKEQYTSCVTKECAGQKIL
jgi:hypothetical protein